MLIKEINYGTPASKSTKTVTLTIDGNKVTVPAGTSVMRAAMEAGTQIPKLCATDSIEAFGSCRLCLIEVEGRNGVLNCVHDPNACVLEPGCVLRHLVIRAEDAFFDTLAKMTIADVVSANTQARKGGLYNLNVKTRAAAAHKTERPQQQFTPTDLISGAMSPPTAAADVQSTGQEGTTP